MVIWLAGKGPVQSFRFQVFYPAECSEDGQAYSISLFASVRACLERVRHENQGVVVLAKLFVARLAGQISNKKQRQVHKSLICNRSKLQTCS